MTNYRCPRKDLRMRMFCTAKSVWRSIPRGSQKHRPWLGPQRKQWARSQREGLMAVCAWVKAAEERVRMADKWPGATNPIALPSASVDDA
eukprot:6200712-Pleurochrysis_carterae.AAC.4